MRILLLVRYETVNIKVHVCIPEPKTIQQANQYHFYDCLLEVHVLYLENTKILVDKYLNLNTKKIYAASSQSFMALPIF